MGFDLTTFFFELANFGLLIFILQRILYRPLREGIERRRAAQAAERARTEEEHAAARALRVQAEERLAEIEKLRETIVADAREQAAKEAARILSEARQDAEVERTRAQRTIEREREQAVTWLREATVDQSSLLAGRLLCDLLPDEADDVLVEALVEALRARDHGTLAALANGSNADAPLELPVELRMPRPPSARARALVDGVLRDLAPAGWQLEVREDPTLLAGPVLRIGDHVLDGSVAGHLEALRERVHALLAEDSP